jgi:threonine dehydratase
MTSQITNQKIQDASRRIATHVRRTPIIALEEGVFGSRARIVLKLESMQHTGSFKPRGAFNCVLSSQVPEAGIVAASGGNHGAAAAYVAHQLGHHAEIFVPTISSPNKVERLRHYGASVNIVGRNYAEALAASKDKAAQTGALDVHAYDDPHVLAGQGTLGMELEEQAGRLDSILIAVGGGGLIGGVAAWYEKRARIIGVEPESAPTLTKALDAGQLLDVETGGLAADSLGARRVGTLMFPIAQQYLDRMVLVNDDDIRRAQTELWRSLRIIAEPGAATVLAALLSGAYQPQPGERLCLVICGGNAELAAFPV